MWEPIKLCPACRGKPTRWNAGVYVCERGHVTHDATSPQERFLASSAFEVLYGGAAGGGKTDALLVGGLRHVSDPSFDGIIFRRTFPELKRWIIERAHAVFPEIGGRGEESGKLWRFPNAHGEPGKGGRIHFASMDHEDDRFNYASAAFQYIAFDELSTFTEKQYRFLFSRLRSAGGRIPGRVRAATNPGGQGHEWILERWAPWLRAKDEGYEGARASSREVLWYRFDAQREADVPCSRDWIDPTCDDCRPGEPCPPHRPRGRSFHPASVEDNPYLAGTEYEATLDTLDPVTRAQLKFGDWLKRPGRGEYFKRAWFLRVPKLPEHVHPIARVRYWDLAGTEDDPRNPKPEGKAAFTAGVRMARFSKAHADAYLQGRQYLVEHVARGQWGVEHVATRARQTADNDPKDAVQVVEQDPGQAGKFQARHWVTETMAGLASHHERPQGDKPTRMRPFSAQAFAQNVAYLEGPWNAEYFGELEACPEGRWDQVDGSSGAFKYLYTRGGGRPGAGSDEGDTRRPASPHVVRGGF